MAKKSTKDTKNTKGAKGAKGAKARNDAKDAKDLKAAQDAKAAREPRLVGARKKDPVEAAAPPPPPAPAAAKRKRAEPVAPKATRAESAKPRAPRKRSTVGTRTASTPGTVSTSTVSTPGTVSTLSTTRSGEALDILMVTPEARPFAKTGGLADVCGALPLALARLGHRVTIVLPKYRQTITDRATGEAGQVPFGLHNYAVHFIEQRVAEGVTAVLIDAPALFDRDGLYGDQHGEFGDNAFRFAVLSRGALEYMRLKARRPSVIHAHDWQAGLAAVYARTALRDDPTIGGVRTVLTIHNLAFQGGFDPKELNWIGLGPDLYTPQLLEYYGRASSLKGGVVFSDVITTVSPTYAREIITPEYGFGFDGILRSRSADLVGILNGIDTEVWNPETDANLPMQFDAATLDRKPEIKRALLQYVGLPTDGWSVARPLMGIVT